MKKALLITCILITVFSCKKKETPKDTEPYVATPAQSRYPRPWNTAFISFQNIPSKCGTHSQGYKLFYKDTLLQDTCYTYGFMNLSNPYYVNDSIMHFFRQYVLGGQVLSTANGGYTWKATQVGSYTFAKFHSVNTQLLYCITESSSDLYFTGVGESELFMYKTSFKKGKHYISDRGTIITNPDSTLITINDSLSFVILFN